jgi:hypothetical protein
MALLYQLQLLPDLHRSAVAVFKPTPLCGESAVAAPAAPERLRHVAFCGLQWCAIGQLCDIPFNTLYTLFAPGSVYGAGCSTGCAALGGWPAVILRTRALW